MVVGICNPSTRDTDAGLLRVQGQPGLDNNFQASLCSIQSHLKNQNKNEKPWRKRNGRRQSEKGTYCVLEKHYEDKVTGSEESNGSMKLLCLIL